jgi:hypothetical protein
MPPGFGNNNSETTFSGFHCAASSISESEHALPHIPIPVDLSFTFSINGFETWWSMWKDHIFRKALGPMLQQIDAEYEASEGEVFSLRTLHDLSFNLSLNRLSPFAATRRSRT